MTHVNDRDSDASELDDEPLSDDNIILRINSRIRSDGVLPASGEPAYDPNDDPYNDIDDDKVLTRKRKRANDVVLPCETTDLYAFNDFDDADCDDNADFKVLGSKVDLTAEWVAPVFPPDTAEEKSRESVV